MLTSRGNEPEISSPESRRVLTLAPISQARDHDQPPHSSCHSFTRIQEPSPQALHCDSWILGADCTRLYPGSLLEKRYLLFLANRISHDYLIRFKFLQPGAGDVLVHQSRLEWAGGPLAGLLNEYFKEGRNRIVKLSLEDDPVSFEHIVLFLYCQKVDFQFSSTTRLLELAKAAHRWQLSELLDGILEVIRRKDLLRQKSERFYASYLLKLDGIPKEFSSYCWAIIGTHFTEFWSVEDASGDSLLDLAIEQDALATVFDSISHESKDNSAMIWKFTLTQIEPRVEDDDKMLALLERLICGLMGFDADFVEKGELDTQISVRAMRLVWVANKRFNVSCYTSRGRSIRFHPRVPSRMIN